MSAGGEVLCRREAGEGVLSLTTTLCTDAAAPPGFSLAKAHALNSLTLVFAYCKWRNREPEGFGVVLLRSYTHAELMLLHSAWMNSLAPVTLTQGFLHHRSLLPAGSASLVCSALPQDWMKAFVSRILSCHLHLGARKAVLSG